MQLILFIFRVPVKVDERQKWMDAIETNQKCEKNARQIDICELHFQPKDINRARQERKLNKGAVPSIFPIKEK